MDPDARLMLAFCAGDESAFDALFRRFAGPLLGYLRRIVRDASVAEELCQETFLRVHRARARYRPEARFSTWLFTIATRLAWNEMRRPWRRSPHESADLEPASLLAAEAPGVDDVAHARRLGASVEAMLATLPERQRAALWLAAVEGQSYAEVAEALDTSEKSVKALVHRARSALVKALPEARAELRGARSGS